MRVHRILVPNTIEPEDKPTWDPFCRLFLVHMGPTCKCWLGYSSRHFLKRYPSVFWKRLPFFDWFLWKISKMYCETNHLAHQVSRSGQHSARTGFSRDCLVWILTLSSFPIIIAKVIVMKAMSSIFQQELCASNVKYSLQCFCFVSTITHTHQWLYWGSDLLKNTLKWDGAGMETTLQLEDNLFYSISRLPHIETYKYSHLFIFFQPEDTF